MHAQERPCPTSTPGSARPWDEHAAEPDGAAAVANRLDAGLALADSDARLAQLAALAQHVHGEHLGQWEPGLRWQRALSAHPQFGASAAQAQRIRGASLEIAAGADAAGIAGLDASERARAAALAACALARRDTARAAALFHAAQAAGRALPDDGPHVRALAVAANNLAAVIEDKPAPTAEERQLMLDAAQAARRWWAAAGGWLETERAEYRLAMSHLKAGDAAGALRHAQLCLEIVEARAAPPLEHFYGWQALALAAGALRDGATAAKAQAQVLRAFEALSTDERAQCRADLDRIDFGRG